MSLPNEKIRSIIYESCLALDEERHDDFLRLFAPDFRYVVRAYSPEIRKEMTWLEADRKEMEHLFQMLPQHVRLQGRFFRHATVYRIVRDESGAQAVTSLTLGYTDPDGVSKLFAVGRYLDEIIDPDGAAKIVRREVRLETRDLSPGVHVPI